MTILHIVWEITPEIFSFWGLTARWYGFFFASSFIIGYYIMLGIYKNENVNVKELDSLFLYVVVGGILGARIGHCLFYEFSYTLKNPLNIIYIWEGGLASHGGALGVIIALTIYSRFKTYKSILWIFDRVVIPIALGGVFIRLGNFFNSEIIGTPSDMPWAVIFANSFEFNDVPRHPAQIYEALSYLLIFVFLMIYYIKKHRGITNGRLLGWFLVLIFSARFFIEFYKENQVAFESQQLLNMGQILSIPLVIAGCALIFRKGQYEKDISKNI